MARLLARLGYREVYLTEGLENATRVRAMWTSADTFASASTGAKRKLMVDSARPELSHVRSALHEIIEPVWEYSCKCEGAAIEVRVRERWADKFAAMVTMPPDLVRLRAADEPGQLAEAMNETLGATLRQLRDVSSIVGEGAETSCVRRRFYYARYGLVDQVPDDLPKSYEAAVYRVEITRGAPGICVLVTDVVVCPGFDYSAADAANLAPEYTPHVRRYQLANPMWIERLRTLLAQDREQRGKQAKVERCRTLTGSAPRCLLSVLSRRGLPYLFSIYPIGDRHAHLRGFFVMCEPSPVGELDHDFAFDSSCLDPEDEDWIVSYDCWEIAVEVPDGFQSPVGTETLWPGLDSLDDC